MKKNIRDIIEALVVWVIVFLMTITNIISPLDYIMKDELKEKVNKIIKKIL